MNSDSNIPVSANEGDSKPGWLTRKIYETSAEKKRDFWIGVGIFFVLNIALSLCQWAAWFGIFTVTPDTGFSDFVSSPLYSILSWVVALLPWVINGGLVIYFALTRSQIALGMVAGFGIALLLVICLGVIFTAWCFYALGSV